MKITMKTVCLLLLGLISTNSFSQTLRTKSMILTEIAEIKLQAQSEINHFIDMTRRQVGLVKKEALDSISLLKSRANDESGKMKLDGQTALASLQQEYESSFFKQHLSKKKFVSISNKLQTDYGQKIVAIEEYYFDSIRSTELYYSALIYKIESEAKSKLDKMQIKYSNQICDLELELT
jgi:hypothetical protein